jgi:hypothetical protein
MTEHGIAKRCGVNRAEPNSILKIVLLEEAVREFLESEPGTSRLSIKQLCEALDRDEAENVEALEHTEGLSSLAAS